jgi:hypothetical protein
LPERDEEKVLSVKREVDRIASVDIRRIWDDGGAVASSSNREYRVSRACLEMYDGLMRDI